MPGIICISDLKGTWPFCKQPRQRSFRVLATVRGYPCHWQARATLRHSMPWNGKCSRHVFHDFGGWPPSFPNLPEWVAHVPAWRACPKNWRTLRCLDCAGYVCPWWSAKCLEEAGQQGNRYAACHWHDGWTLSWNHGEGFAGQCPLGAACLDKGSNPFASTTNRSEDSVRPSWPDANTFARIYLSREAAFLSWRQRWEWRVCSCPGRCFACKAWHRSLYQGGLHRRVLPILGSKWWSHMQCLCRRGLGHHAGLLLCGWRRQRRDCTPRTCHREGFQFHSHEERWIDAAVWQHIQLGQAQNN